MLMLAGVFIPLETSQLCGTELGESGCRLTRKDIFTLLGWQHTWASICGHPIRERFRESNLFGVYFSFTWIFTTRNTC